jgi:hypothetical protein
MRTFAYRSGMSADVDNARDLRGWTAAAPRISRRDALRASPHRVAEIVLTAFPMLVITAAATDSRAVGAAPAIAISGTVGLDVNCSVDQDHRRIQRPAHSLGPTLAAGQWTTGRDTSRDR